MRGGEKKESEKKEGEKLKVKGEKLGGWEGVRRREGEKLKERISLCESVFDVQRSWIRKKSEFRFLFIVTH